MAAASLRDQIIHELDNLTHAQQAQLLDLARRLQRSPLPPGTPGDALAAHMDDFDFAPGAVDDIMRAVEEGCERIDWSGWQ